MNAKINNKVETLRRFFADSKASNHPIDEHPVSKAEEYVRNLYFDMLCVVAQYEYNDTENAFTLIKRIMSACENVQPLEEYIRRSMELTTEKATEFIKQCKDNNLCEIFFVDSLLLSCSNGTPNAKQVAFLSQFGDMLGFDKADMTEIAKFAVAILEQDSEGYQEILNENNANIQTSLLCYAKEFVTGLIICTSKKRYYYAKKLADYTINENDLDEDGQLVISTLDEVRFENLIISDVGKLNLRIIKNVVFEGCHCMRGPLGLISIDKVLINNCEFKWAGTKNESKGNHSINRAIWANLRNFTLTVTNTNFSGYEVRRYDTGGYYRNNYYYSGAVFYNENEEYNSNNISFDRCNFSDIYTAQSESGYYGTNAICYSHYDDVEVTNCHFSNCRSDRVNNNLFSSIRRESDNILVNSNPIKN